MVADQGESLFATWFKEGIRVARERIIKYPPKRGRLKRSEVKRVVERVVHGKRGGGEAGQTRQPEKKK